MLTKNIIYNKFKTDSNNLPTKKKVFKILNYYLSHKLVQSFSKNYKYSFEESKINKLKKYSNYLVIGMGGSSLGIEAIYNFLKFKIKKKFLFLNNLNFDNFKNNKEKKLNIIISKSGNTLETISNFNYLKNKKNNLFICEKSNNYLRNLAIQLKCEIIEHKNYIGGRYSVLSEVGMLPSILMGLDHKKFKNLNYLVKQKNFINALTNSVSSTVDFAKKKN